MERTRSFICARGPCFSTYRPTTTRTVRRGRSGHRRLGGDSFWHLPVESFRRHSRRPVWVKEFDVAKVRDDTWQKCLVDGKPKLEFIAVAGAILSNYINGDSTVPVSHTGYLQLALYCVEDCAADQPIEERFQPCSKLGEIARN